MGDPMSKGLIECKWKTEWIESIYGADLDDLILDGLLGRLKVPRRYREGKRAVMLWPEERMGEVVDCG